MPAQRRNLKFPAHIQQHHVDQRKHRGHLLHTLGGRQTQNISQIRFPQHLLRRELFAQLRLNLLHFLQRELRRIQASWNLPIQIPSNDAAHRNRSHDPERHAGKPAKLKGSVQCNDERCGNPQQNMVVQPMPRTSLLPQPRPFFAQRIEENRQKHHEPEDTKLHANRAARLQQRMFRREWPLRRIQRVVVEPVSKDPRYQCHRQQVSDLEPRAMALLRVDDRLRWGDDDVRWGCGLRTHWAVAFSLSTSFSLSATFSSVLTENLL